MDKNIDGLIQLPQFRFPQHYLIQEWLSGTEYGERYFLVLVEAEHTSPRGGIKRISTPALEPITGEEKFLVQLRGDESNIELARELEQKILDFHKK